MQKGKKRILSIRIAIFVLAITLITGCVALGTYAKYVTSDLSLDYARIAKFGVVIEANGTTFSNSYDSEDSIGRSVVKSVLSGDKVVAPGTRGKMVSMSISGSPEVSVEIKYTAEFFVCNWDVLLKDGSSKFYCPITITVGDSAISGLKFTDADEFAAAVNAEIEKFSDKYYVGEEETLELKKVVKVPSVSWEWAFEGGNDEYDTYLGNKVCQKPSIGEENKNLVTIGLVITTTVSQID